MKKLLVVLLAVSFVGAISGRLAGPCTGVCSGSDGGDLGNGWCSCGAICRPDEWCSNAVSRVRANGVAGPKEETLTFTAQPTERAECKAHCNATGAGYSWKRRDDRGVCKCQGKMKQHKNKNRIMIESE